MTTCPACGEESPRHDPGKVHQETLCQTPGCSTLLQWDERPTGVAYRSGPARCDCGQRNAVAGDPIFSN